MTAVPQIDLTNWLSDAEACARLGYRSSKTLDREVKRNHLHPQYRPRERNRPQRVWDPEEIGRRMRPAPVSVLPPVSTVQTHTPPVQTGVPTSVPTALQTFSTPMSEPSVPDSASRALVRPEETDRVIARLVEMVVDARKPPKPWLTLEEAAAELGLSRAFVYRLVRKGKLDGVKDRRIKVRREDLEDLDVSTELVRQDRRRK